jgi:hypothetical protein
MIAGRGERYRQHDDERFGHTTEIEVEKQEDDEHSDRHHDRKSRLRPLE